MSGDTPVPFHGRPPRGGRSGFFDRLVPPAVESARRTEGAARLWGVQLTLGILLYGVAQAIGIGAGLALSLLLGETTREAIAGAGGHRITLFPIGLLVGSAITAAIGLAGYWGLMRLVRRRTIRELSGPGRHAPLLAERSRTHPPMGRPGGRLRVERGPAAWSSSRGEPYTALRLQAGRRRRDRGSGRHPPDGHRG